MTTDKNTTPTVKRSFDFKRTDHYLCDPYFDLCIVGGADLLPEYERGPLDVATTVSDATMQVLRDDERLREPLSESFVRNIATLGVLETIVIAKIGDVAVVVEGRTRVRGARQANKLRAERGEPIVKVPCIIRRSDASDLLAVMISGNEQRRAESIVGKIEKLKRYMARGVDVHQAADVFGVSVGVVESWLRFDDTAIASVKEAVDSGQLALSAGMSVARLKDPAKQQEVLTKLQETTSKPSAPGKSAISTRAARNAAKTVERPDAHHGVSDKRTLRALLKLTKDKDHGSKASKETFAFWEGVEAALTLIVGGDDKPDERLITLLGAATLASKGGAK